MQYKINDIVNCTVVGLQPYGAFVELDDHKTRGLLHISEISNEFISDIHDFFKIGDVTKARIIEINEEDQQISLSLTKLPKCEREQLDNFQEKPVFSKGFSTLETQLEIWLKELEEEYEGKI